MFNDGTERVLSEMLFHADVTRAAKVRPRSWHDELLEWSGPWL